MSMHQSTPSEEKGCSAECDPDEAQAALIYVRHTLTHLEGMYDLGEWIVEFLRRSSSALMQPCLRTQPVLRSPALMPLMVAVIARSNASLFSPPRLRRKSSNCNRLMGST